MSKSKKLTESELSARAKVLYFDKNKKIGKIYADEFGRFSYQKGYLIEANKGTDVKIFEINKNGLKVDAEAEKAIKDRTDLKHLKAAKAKKEEEKKK